MEFIRRNWPFFVTLLIALPGVAVIAFELVFWQKIYLGVKVAGWDLSGLNQVQAEELISQKLAAIKPEICFKTNEENWCLLGEKINLKFFPQQTVKQAFQVGRQGNFWSNLTTKTKLLKQEANLPLIFDFDQSLLMAQLATPTAGFNQPIIPPLIELEGQAVKITPPKQGQQINKNQLIALVKKKLGFLDFFSAIEIPVIKLGKDYSSYELTKIKERAERLLVKSIILTSKKKNLVVDGKQLINFIGWDQAWNLNQMESYVKILAEDFDQPAKNALFKFEKGKVVAFAVEEDGLRLDKEKTYFSLLNCLESLIQEGLERCVIDLELSEIKPEIRVSEINQFGIVELLGRGESFFSGSAESRIHNLTLASEKINGQIVAPHTLFSFNQAVGEISTKTGYKTAYIIQNGRTILGDGGGVCQVSTTLFRAVLNAGLPIVERHSHAYRVHYYEEGSPVGFDATVFAPSVDFKFKNDLSSHILIQAKVDKINKHLIFEIYGTNDGRRVEISKVKIWDQTPPPEDLYLDDPSLPLGVVKQIDFKAWGAKAIFDWKVYRGEELLHQQSFYSYYKPWRAIFLRGTKK